MDLYIGQGLPHQVELVVARPYLFALFLAGTRVFLLDDLGIVFEDVGQPSWREDFFPEVVGLETVRVRWIPCASVIAPVEGQKPRTFTLEFGTHAHLAVINSEMHGTAPKLEQPLAGIAVALVLHNRIL